MMGTRTWAFLVVLALVCGQHAARSEDARSVPLGLDLHMPIPEENPLTAEKVALGRRLFSDPRLSRDGRLSCASCHDPQRAFADGRSVSAGVDGRLGRRNAPTLINRGYGQSQFWDGRAASLEAQVLQPIVDPKELDLAIDEAVRRLAGARAYRDGFRAVFGRDVSGDDLARALASYVRSILAANSPLDRYLNGERDALAADARAGLDVFRGKGNCSACHVGPTLTDEAFHNTGVGWKDGAWLDLGRYTVTGQDAERGAFKTPTLREIARTAPYMHDGSLATLEAVVDFYNQGGNPNPFLDREMRPLNLTDAEKRALVAFLAALTGEIREGVDEAARR